MQKISALLSLVLLAACPETPAPPAPPAPAPASASAPASQPARARAARARLSSSEAGRLILAATIAHGGREAVLDRDALRFRYAYTPTSGRPPRDTTQTIDLKRARALHEGHAPKGRFAWDGERCWTTMPEGFPARFWALTPYYFVALPFVLGDDGVKLAMSNEDPTAAGFPGAKVVEVTFAAGTGDAPDDTYGLYLDPKTHRLLAVRYTVSYAPFFAGKETRRSAEKLLVYTDPQTLDGLVLPMKHTFYALGEGRTRGDVVTVATLSEVDVRARLDEAALVMPAGARLDTALD